MSKRPLQTIAKKFPDDVIFEATTGKNRHNCLLINDSNANAAVVAAELTQLLMKKGLEFEVSRVPTEEHPVPDGLTLPTDEDTYILFSVSPFTAAKRPKKDPNAPKRTMTRYNAFLKIRGPVLKTMNKDSKPLEVKTLLTEDWKTYNGLADEDKEDQYPELGDAIDEMVAADKVRFDTETAAYEGKAKVAVPKAEAGEKPAKPVPAEAAEKPAAKKATNGWLLFSAQERPKVKAANPEMPAIQTTQVVAANWKALGDAGKAAWHAKAKE